MELEDGNNWELEKNCWRFEYWSIGLYWNWTKLTSWLFATLVTIIGRRLAQNCDFYIL